MSYIRPKFVFLALITIFVLVGSFFIPITAKGFNFQVPFGGRIITTIGCSCSPGTTWITVGPPRGGSFLKTPATRVYAKNRVQIGRAVLGLALPVQLPCLQTAVPACVPIGFGNPINIIGTN